MAEGTRSPHGEVGRFCGEELVGASDNLENAAAEAVRRFGRGLV